LDAIHDRGKAVLIELPNVEEGEVQRLSDSLGPELGEFALLDHKRDAFARRS
jgi:hypothetical protein